MSNDANSRNASCIFDIKEIDEQHQMLFGFLDELEAALKTERSWVVVHEVLVQLGHWTKIHFAVEEALMGIMGYPETQRHREMHDVFVRKLQENMGKVLRENIAAETANWLCDWLTHHIAIEDRAYTEHFHRCVVLPS